VDSREGRGTTFKIFLPATNETPEPPDAGSQGQASITLQGLGKSILLVEDEPGVRSLAALVLQGAGYKVCACESAQEAKAFFANKDAHFDLLFSDVVLVGQNGIDLALELRTKCPTLPVLLCSGYADDSVRWESIQHECFHFLPKPYPTAKLLSSVRDALTAHQ
jgi:DNA-binding NtrC family response regulator